MSLERPLPHLRPFVEGLWAIEDRRAARHPVPVREHALPSGAMHLVFRLNDAPLRIFDPGGERIGQTIGHAVIGGLRSRYYVRELSAQSCSVGVVLRPGAARLLFGVAADELAGRHTALDDVWGADAQRIGERLREATSAPERLAIIQAVLAARLPSVRGVHPAVAHILERMHRFPNIHAAVDESGLSHRRFALLFRQAVGVPPKTWSRLLRFRKALRLIRPDNGLALATVAAECGYSDQAHFSREFLDLSGVTPGAYRALAPHEPGHVPIDRA